ncbi:ribosomal protein S16, putative [Eimeria necatrix]|uniref:Ribosomal protein S16, putative n=1 Tax=Eimeria necatrix TaxID=51315 RepID=U6MLS9_9EIME|nr:ribosomal protein S16, putative [Eimeria necatrix]CDJ64981.1 ribosomal protein S16, putative [Eimeria necatrix]
MVRRMFLPFYSKDRGPPRIRMQVMGTKGRRFYKIVAANQRDPRDGKHMEVLGSYVPIPGSSTSSVAELRLRFSRVKFWLAANASMSLSISRLLGSAGLIPLPPPLFGWRCRGRYHELLQQQQQQQLLRESELRNFFKLPSPISTQLVERETEKPKKENVRKIVR